MAWKNCTSTCRRWDATLRMKKLAAAVHLCCRAPRTESPARFCTSMPATTSWDRRGDCWRSSRSKMSSSVTVANEKSTLVAIAVVEHDGKSLVGERPAGVALAGFAEFPGGKVEPGESPEAAAVRECIEESGLQVEIVR